MSQHRLTDGPDTPVPARAGIGLKADHVAAILETAPEVGFFEFHAENYMGAGGPPHRQLAAIGERYALSMHGVGLSIGADRPLDRDHLARLKTLHERYRPALFSEHLAWSSHGGTYFNDLLPVPYTDATLARIAAHIDTVQGTLGRRMLLENPSTYVMFTESTWGEVDFLAEIVRRTGCGLLLDVNNVYISATNHGFSPEAYLDAFPLEAVGELHLAGHASERDDADLPLLIDAHDREVADAVWGLYERVIARAGLCPTLIEWDNAVPPLDILLAEGAKADRILDLYRPLGVRHGTYG